MLIISEYKVYIYKNYNIYYENKHGKKYKMKSVVILGY